MFVTGLFFQRHCSHDSPADVVFSHFPRCSVPVCLPFLFLCIVRRGVCVYVLCMSYFLVASYASRHYLTALFSTSQAWRFWCGFCCSKTCCSSMACVAVSHPFIDDYHPFSGHRFTLSLNTNITCSTHPTSIHNLPTNEQTHLHTQTTRGCFTPPNHPKETSLHHSKEHSQTTI